MCVIRLREWVAEWPLGWETPQNSASTLALQVGQIKKQMLGKCKIIGKPFLYIFHYSLAVLNRINWANSAVFIFFFIKDPFLSL